MILPLKPIKEKVWNHWFTRICNFEKSKNPLCHDHIDFNVYQAFWEEAIWSGENIIVSRYRGS